MGCQEMITFFHSFHFKLAQYFLEIKKEHIYQSYLRSYMLAFLYLKIIIQDLTQLPLL